MGSFHVMSVLGCLLRLLHGLEVAGHDELAAGGLLHVLHGEALADLPQVHAGVLVDVEHALEKRDLKKNVVILVR